ncbi:emp24/gp25L/p24 family/GOLD family protein [Trifolium repens]|nr:emp24/gp25L/p24 family/GOLD family protein [Trifolium repens]
MDWLSQICTIVIILLGSIISHAFSLSISLHDVECVSENVPHDGDTVSGNFVVMDHDIFWSSDHPGIDFTVTSPGGNVVHSLKGTSGDKFEFKATISGIYKFCFHNPITTPETVSFYVHVGHIPNEHDLAKDEHLDPINVKIAELREALESIITEQKYLKARDARHRNTNESTRKRVVFYTLMEYILFVTTSILQVVYIRRLFSKSFAYNRV